MAVDIVGLSKRFGSFVALDDVSFSVPDGSLVALLGPSGGGKSTVLRVISGLESADQGTVRIDGEAVDSLHARDRRVGFVFQHYALFRHMTVADNIAFGLTVRGVDKRERQARVEELLEIMALRGLGARLPAQLSGGQRQRVALARALAPAPRLLLLDEPFAAVDAKVRAELRRWLRRLHDELHVTSIFVTHDQEEAFSVADQVVLINRGKVEQLGTPRDILDRPASEFVSTFVGDVNVFDGAVRGGQAWCGALRAAAPGFAEAAPVRVVIRSYDLKMWRADAEGVATVSRLVPLGDRVRVDAVVDGAGDIFSHFPRRSSLLKDVEAGCRVAVEVTLARVYPRPGAVPLPKTG